MRDIPAPPRCELCGALLEDAGHDTPETTEDLASLLRSMADMYVADPRILGLIMLRVRFPSASQREIAARLKISPARMTQIMHEIEAISSPLSDALRIIVAGNNEHQGGAVSVAAPRFVEGQMVTAIDRNGKPIVGPVAEIVMPGRVPQNGGGGNARHPRPFISYVIKTDRGMAWPRPHTIQAIQPNRSNP